MLQLPSLEQRSPDSPASIGLPFNLLLLAFIIPSHSFRLGLLPIIILLSIRNSIWVDAGNAGNNFGLASASIHLIFEAIDRILLRDLEQMMGIESDKKVAWTERVWRSIKLKASMRGLGYNWQVAQFEKVNLSRRRFLFTRLIQILVGYVILDLLSTFFRASPYFMQKIRPETISELFFNCFLGGIVGWNALSLAYNVVSVISVASRLYQVEDCPPLFGKISSMSSLLGFWGEFWHQSFRGTIGNIAKTLTSFIPSSSARSIATVTIAFFLSGVLHAASIFAMNRRGLATFVFFMAQPVGIVIETLVIRGKSKRSKLRKLLGFIFTFLFILSTGSLFLDDLIQGGLFEINLCSLSLVNRIRKGNWWV